MKPLLNGHLRDLPKSPLNRGCKNCAMFVKDEHSTVTLYCGNVPYVIEETKEAKEAALYFAQDF